jgi:hypothetical protein
VNGQNEGAPARRDFAQHAHHVARLTQVEPVERLVHQHQRMRGEQRQGKQEPAPVALR